jgi:integrase
MWWASYYRNGVELRESTRIRVDDSSERSEKKALAFLKERTEEVTAEKKGGSAFVTARQQRITVSELLDALEADFKLRGIYNARVASHMRPVREHFGYCRAVDLTAEDVDSYIANRRAAGRSDTTINRETQPLAKAFKLAIERKHLSAMPKVRHLSEKENARQGFFSDTEFRSVVAGLPSHLRDFARFAYLTGWRKGEIASLRWEDVEGDVIRLRARNSKNREARMVTLDGELADIIEQCQLHRQVNSKEGDVMLCGSVFHKHGKPIRDTRKAWATACRLAGVQGKLFHDLRRTAVRNMVRAGVPERVAMDISGHKTRSIFDRYNIVSERDLRDAMLRTQSYLIAAAARESKPQAETLKVQ